MSNGRLQERERLRRALREVRLAPAYEDAIESGIDAAVAAWPATYPEKQLDVARRVAGHELAARLGWQ